MTCEQIFNAKINAYFRTLYKYIIILSVLEGFSWSLVANLVSSNESCNEKYMWFDQQCVSCEDMLKLIFIIWHMWLSGSICSEKLRWWWLYVNLISTQRCNKFLIIRWKTTKDTFYMW